MGVNLSVNATGRFNASEVRNAVSATCVGNHTQLNLGSNKPYSPQILFSESSAIVFTDLTPNPAAAVDTVLVDYTILGTDGCQFEGVQFITTNMTIYNFEAHYWPDYYLNEIDANGAVLTPCTPVANATTVSCSNANDTVATCLLSGYEQLMPGAACTLSSDSGGLSTGPIAGITCGAIVLVFLLVLLYKKKSKKATTNTINEDGTGQVLL